MSHPDRQPRSGETLVDYVDRVVCGRRRPWRLDVRALHAEFEAGACGAARLAWIEVSRPLDVPYVRSESTFMVGASGGFALRLL